MGSDDSGNGSRTGTRSRDRRTLVSLDAGSADLPASGPRARELQPAVLPAGRRSPGSGERIRSALRPGGRFAGELFGDRDTWASDPDMTFHDGVAARARFEGLEVESFVEEDEDGEAFDGTEALARVPRDRAPTGAAMRIVLQRVRHGLRDRGRASGSRRSATATCCWSASGRGDPADEPERLAETDRAPASVRGRRGQDEPVPGRRGGRGPRRLAVHALRGPAQGTAARHGAMRRIPRSRPNGSRRSRPRSRATGCPSARGVFGAMMDVELVNDGPFTLVLEGSTLSPA